MNKYYCSDGSRVSQATIDKRRGEAYRERYGDTPQSCHGCGRTATCSAHIIAQARCKVLHLTDLIWNPLNFFPSCYICNSRIENPRGEGGKKLCNLEECLVVIREYDPVLYSKFEQYEKKYDLPDWK